MAWAALVPLTLLPTLAVVMRARLLVHPHTVVVSPRGYWHCAHRSLSHRWSTSNSLSAG